MRLLSRIRETMIKVAILLLISLTTFVSLDAQSLTGRAASTYNFNTGEAIKNIRVIEDINPDAEAAPLRNFINSPYDDIKPRITPDGHRLYFSRNFHPGNSNGVDDPEDIWYSDYNADLDQWSEPIHMKGVLNNAGPNYVNNISTSGDTIVLGNQYRKKGRMHAGLSYSVNVNGVWSAPKAIHIVNDYNLSAHANAYVSLDNGVIIQSVERGESIGGRDLFVSFWDGDHATEPVNMGAVINTEWEESSPFLAADRKTLYFASEGHSGYGGYDIYVTRRLDDTWTNWSKPENLGPAVNGPMDDEFFSITRSGNYAIFSKQVNVHNNDLFRISMDELFKRKSDTEYRRPAGMERAPLASL